MPEDGILGQIDLNITTLTHLIRLFLPPMIQRRSGRIMNVASTAAFQPGPLMAVYMRARPMFSRSQKRWPTNCTAPALL
jgi:short-subunit dehydrogenase